MSAAHPPCCVAVLFVPLLINHLFSICSLLISRVSMQEPLLPSLCHQRWGVQGLWTLEQLLEAMHLPHSSTSCLTSNHTHSCCTTILLRMDRYRYFPAVSWVSSLSLHTCLSVLGCLPVYLCLMFRVVRASAASPVACSRRAKSTSRATAAPLTGPTENDYTCDVCVHHTSISDWQDHRGTNDLQHKLKHTHYHHPPPLCSVYPLFKFMAVVCKIYLCMYLYSIYVLVGHKMWFSAFFLFWRTFYFKIMERWEC